MFAVREKRAVSEINRERIGKELMYWWEVDEVEIDNV